MKDILRKLECYDARGTLEEPWMTDSSLVVKNTLTKQINPFLFLCEQKDVEMSVVDKTILSNQAAILCALSSFSKDTSHLCEAYFHIGNQLSGISAKTLPVRDPQKRYDETNSDRPSFSDFVLESKNVTNVNDEYLEFSDGSITSIPYKNNQRVVVRNNQKKQIRIHQQKFDKYYVEIENKSDKSFKSVDSLVKWMNKNKYLYFVGIDDG
jgi:hypothetical protein